MFRLQDIPPIEDISQSYKEGRVISQVLEISCSTIYAGTMRLSGQFQAASLQNLPFFYKPTAGQLVNDAVNPRCVTDFVSITEGVAMVSAVPSSNPYCYFENLGPES